MTSRGLARTCVAGFVSLALSVTAASAHGSGTHPALRAVQGLVTSASAGAISIVTQTGSVSATLTAHTRVERVASGSMADVRSGTEVQLQIGKGTTTVTAIRVVPAGDAQPQKSTQVHTGTHTSPPRTKTPVAQPGATHTTTGRPHTASHPTRHVGGQVVNASSTTVTVRNRRGETSTYTLSSNVTVIKVMVGRIADLAVGQTVQAVITTSGNALVVTILKA